MRIRIIFLLTCILLFDSTVIAQDDTADSQSSISEPDETQDDEPIFDAEMLEEILAENEPEAEPIKPIALPPVKTELAPFWGELWAGAGISANLSLSGFAGLGWGAGAVVEWRYGQWGVAAGLGTGLVNTKAYVFKSGIYSLPMTAGESLGYVQWWGAATYRYDLLPKLRLIELIGAGSQSLTGDAIRFGSGLMLLGQSGIEYDLLAKLKIQGGVIVQYSSVRDFSDTQYRYPLDKSVVSLEIRLFAGAIYKVY